MQEMRERIARQDQDQEVAQVIEVSYLSTEYTALYYTMAYLTPFDTDPG